MKKTIWFDIDNVPHVNFFLPIVRQLKSDYNIIYSVKNFAETRKLFERNFGSDYLLIGDHKGKSKIAKIYGVIERTGILLKKIPNFDVKISIGGDSSNLCAKLRGKKSITFDDNELAPNWRYSWLSDLAFWPKVVPIEILKKQGFTGKKTYRYDGFKEEVYIADYVPDESFTKSIPFNDYVVVRAENLKANYVDSNLSITKDLLIKLSQSGHNIVFLPRYKDDYLYSEGIKDVFIPDSPLNGLDLCFYAKAVYTGAGTLAREAACLGVPAFSFYAGSRLLKVDEAMIAEGKIYYSRDVDDLLNNIGTIKRNTLNFNHCVKVRDEVVSILKQKLDEF